MWAWSPMTPISLSVAWMLNLLTASWPLGVLLRASKSLGEFGEFGVGGEAGVGHFLGDNGLARPGIGPLFQVFDGLDEVAVVAVLFLESSFEGVVGVYDEFLAGLGGTAEQHGGEGGYDFCSGYRIIFGLLSVGRV